jgi:hypothetical protein
MIEPKRFLMHYYIGARGDFLCNLLCDKKYDINATFYSLPPPTGRVVKVHSIKNGAISTIDSFPEEITNYDDMFRLADEHQLIKIKIIATTDEEKMDVAYFGWLKSLYYGIDRNRPYITVDKRDIENHAEEIKKNAIYLTTALTSISKMQREDGGYEEKYDYIVKFDDLFKMDYLKDIYEQVNKKSLPLSYIPRIKANLAIQNRLSESVNYPYFKEIIFRQQKIHEEHVAIDNLIQQLT